MTAKWTFVLCDALAKVHPVRDPRPVAAATRFQAFLGEPASFQLAYRPPLDPTFRDPRPLQVRIEGEAGRPGRGVERGPRALRVPRAPGA